MTVLFLYRNYVITCEAKELITYIVKIIWVALQEKKRKRTKMEKNKRKEREKLIISKQGKGQGYFCPQHKSRMHGLQQSFEHSILWKYMS